MSNWNMVKVFQMFLPSNNLAQRCPLIQLPLSTDNSFILVPFIQTNQPSWNIGFQNLKTSQQGTLETKNTTALHPKTIS